MNKRGVVTALALALVLGTVVFRKDIKAYAQIPESDVIGLIGDLSVRVLMGPGFGVSRTAIVNDVGEVETAVGALFDCMLVDGTSKPCGNLDFIYDDVPAGLVNGTNSTFTVAYPPVPAASLKLFKNGVYQKNSLDFTLSGRTITFTPVAIPQAGDTLIAAQYTR
jgi:hypothetical protein